MEGVMTPVTSVEQCRDLVQAAFPSLLVTDVRHLGEGWDSTVFEINSTLIFRFPKREAIDYSIRREIAVLARVQPLMPVPVPDVRYVGGPLPCYPWHFAGYPKLEGTALSDVTLTHDDIKCLAVRLAQFFDALWSVPIETVVDLELPMFTPVEWVEHHRRLYLQCLPTLEEHLASAVLSRVVEWWTDALRQPALERFDPVLIHGDLASEHILLDLPACEIGGVIDFGDAMVADPAFDLAGLPEPLARTVARHLDLESDHEFWLRRHLYTSAVPLHAISSGVDLGRLDLIRSGITGIEMRFGRKGRDPRFTR